MKTKRTLAIVLVLLMALAFVPAMASASLPAPETLTCTGGGSLYSGAPMPHNPTFTGTPSNPGDFMGFPAWQKHYELYLANGETATLGIGNSVAGTTYTFYISDGSGGSASIGTAPASVSLTDNPTSNTGFWVVLEVDDNTTQDYYGIWVWPVERVNATSGAGGSIEIDCTTASNPNNVSTEIISSNSSKKFSYDDSDTLVVKLVPASGYSISGLTLNGASVTLTNSTYTLNLTGNSIYNLVATFTKIPVTGGVGVPPPDPKSTTTTTTTQQPAASPYPASGKALKKIPVYPSASTKGKKLGTIGKFDEFTVTGFEGGFAIIEWNGQTGYVQLDGTNIDLNASIKGVAKNKIKVYSRMNTSKKYYVGFFDKGEILRLIERNGKWWKLSGDEWYVQAKDVNW